MNDKDINKEQLKRIELPLYPKAFIAASRLGKERDRVFVSMPFNVNHSEKLWKILNGVCEIYGLNIHRADERVCPTPIVSDILDEIERAEIIIADLTDLNPNVLYEIGISHVRCDSVILLCQKGQNIPFNLSAIRCLFFDLSTREGQVELADRLGKTINALKAVGPPTVIESKIERTKTIINDLETLLNLSNEDLSKEVVWFSGSLSAFAINPDEQFQPEEKEYQINLLKEKETLLLLAHRGCLIKIIITPPNSRFVVTHRLDIMKQRLCCLLRFLKSDDEALQSIEWVISPFRQKNIYIIGHISFLEGYKKGIQRGFSLTLRQTDLNAISANISLYEALFNHQETYTLVTYGNKRNCDRREALRLATINCIEESLNMLNSDSIEKISEPFIMG